MQKFTTIGSSTGVIIPKKPLAELGVTVGDEFNLVVDKKNKQYIIEIVGKEKKLTKEFASWTDEFIENYKPALTELKDK